MKILLSIIIWISLLLNTNACFASGKMTVWEKILKISHEKNISIKRLEDIILDYIKRKNISSKIRSLVTNGFQEARILKKQKEKVKIHQKIKNYLLYPYYKDVYLSAKSEELLKKNIFTINTWEKKVYLTFDDGPHKKATLDYFKKNNIAASFFLICNKINSQNIQAYKDVLFTIWAHTFSHKNYDTFTRDELSIDINKCKSIFEQNNIKLDTFRPAFGVINPNELDILEENNITNYLWNIDSLDWYNGFTKEYAHKMAEKTQSWDIILFHENVDLNRLDYYIKLLEKRGFSFWAL